MIYLTPPSSTLSPLYFLLHFSPLSTSLPLSPFLRSSSFLLLLLSPLLLLLSPLLPRLQAITTIGPPECCTEACYQIMKIMQNELLMTNGMMESG